MSVEKSSAAGLRIGVDIGGTFTDLALIDAEGNFQQCKSPSTPGDPSVGVFRVLERAARDHGLELKEMLHDVQMLVIGTTVATNIMVEKHGARVGLLCTEGFRDTLAIRRGIRDNVWDLRRPHPQVLVPRNLRIGIAERTSAAGQVTRAVDEQQLAKAIEYFRSQQIEAVAIAFFNSYLNSENEKRAAAIVRRLMPEAFVSVSSEILPVMGEYERTSTAVINAFVGPKTARYLMQLSESLASSGLIHPPWIMQSNGGLVSARTLVSQPVGAVLSGPAGGGAAAGYWGTLAKGKGVVFFDMGGTSADISFAVDGAVSLTDRTAIGGYHIALPTVDIKTIGTGGGTIAHVDRGGMLQVGPRSAGSEPGPVAYGNGGVEPTVTDANLVLGRLNPERFLGGEMTLDKAGSERAMRERIAEPLSIHVSAAAHSIIRLANQNMSNAVQEVAAEAGIDLRELTLVAAGGAAGLHVCEIARLLGMRQVYVPREASVACAFGMLRSDVRQDIVSTWIDNLAQIDPQALRDRIERAADDGVRLLVDGGITRDTVTLEVALDLRYRGQSWQIKMPVSSEPSREALDALADDFHKRHEQLYGYHEPNGIVEVVNVRVAVISKMPRVDAPTADDSMARPAPRPDHRTIYLDGEQSISAAIYDGQALMPGHTLQGPAVIEEPNTTLLVGAGDELLVDCYNNFLIRRAAL